jgi:hypothetical protein
MKSIWLNKLPTKNAGPNPESSHQSNIAPAQRLRDGVAPTTRQLWERQRPAKPYSLTQANNRFSRGYIAIRALLDSLFSFAAHPYAQ